MIESRCRYEVEVLLGAASRACAFLFRVIVALCMQLQTMCRRDTCHLLAVQSGYNKCLANLRALGSQT